MIPTTAQNDINNAFAATRFPSYPPTLPKLHRATEVIDGVFIVFSSYFVCARLCWHGERMKPSTVCFPPGPSAYGLRQALNWAYGVQQRAADVCIVLNVCRCLCLPFGRTYGLHAHSQLSVECRSDDSVVDEASSSTNVLYVVQVPSARSIQIRSHRLHFVESCVLRTVCNCAIFSRFENSLWDRACVFVSFYWNNRESFIVVSHVNVLWRINYVVWINWTVSNENSHCFDGKNHTLCVCVLWVLWVQSYKYAQYMKNRWGLRSCELNEYNFECWWHVWHILCQCIENDRSGKKKSMRKKNRTKPIYSSGMMRIPYQTIPVNYCFTLDCILYMN